MRFTRKSMLVVPMAAAAFGVAQPARSEILSETTASRTFSSFSEFRQSEGSAVFKDGAASEFAENRSNVLVLIPNVQSTDTTTTYGAGLNYLSDTSNVKGDFGKKSFSLRVGYKSIRPRTNLSHLTNRGFGASYQLTGAIKERIIKNEGAEDSKKLVNWWPIAVSADSSKTRGGASTQIYTLEISRQLSSEPKEKKVFEVTGTLSYARARAAGVRASDVIPGVEVRYITPQALQLSAEYTPKSDLDPESDYAVAAKFKVGDGKAKIGVGKHSRVFFNYTLSLGSPKP